jgi:hypothetical protein
MDTPLTLLVVGLPLAMLGVAAWPLLCLPRVRAVLLGAGGTCCVCGGTTIAGLLAAGMLPLPGFAESAAVAQDASPAAKNADSVSASSSSNPAVEVASGVEVVPAAPATPAAVPPLPTSPAPTAPAAPAPASTAPAPPIEVSPPVPGQDDPKHDDIKIETRPDGTVIIPAGRPDWVQHPRRTRSGDVHQITVSSGPYATDLQAERALDEELVKATNEYIAEQLGSEIAPTLLHYTARTIKEKYVKPGNTYHEQITVSIGDMQQRHALLEFDDSFRKEIQSTWVGKIAESRLLQLGVVAGGVLLLLGSVFGYFRLDNATRGYYTGRLQFMTAAAILAVVALGAAAAFRFTWL